MNTTHTAPRESARGMATPGERARLAKGGPRKPDRPAPMGAGDNRGGCPALAYACGSDTSKPKEGTHGRLRNTWPHQRPPSETEGSARLGDCLWRTTANDRDRIAVTAICASICAFRGRCETCARNHATGSDNALSASSASRAWRSRRRRSAARSRFSFSDSTSQGLTPRTRDLDISSRLLFGLSGVHRRRQVWPDQPEVIRPQICASDGAASGALNRQTALGRNVLQAVRPLRDHDRVHAHGLGNRCSRAAGGCIEVGSQVHAPY